MDIVTLAMAKAYSDSKALGGSETNTVKWVSTDTDGRVSIGDSLFKVSDLTPTIEELEGGILTGELEGESFSVTLSVAENTLIEDSGVIGIYIMEGAAIFAVYPSGLSGNYEPGIYGATGTDFDRANFTLQWETIHTIDPKYLPGVCLPVVELSTVITESGTALTEAESAALTEAFESGLPIVCKFSYTEDGDEGVTSQSCVFQQLIASETNAYYLNSLDRSWTLVNLGDDWGVIYG